MAEERREISALQVSAMNNTQEIERLLSDLESDRTERTQSLEDTPKFCRAICAFSNDMPGHRLPGYVFVGVSRDGEPTGASITERLLESLASHRDNGQIVPIPSIRVFKHAFTERRVDRARTWDLQGCRDATIDDLALELFTINYLPQAVSRDVLAENRRTIEDQLASLRLYHKSLGVPTNGAVLLFAKDPESFFPGAYVQYVRYGGTSQADEVLSERRISGDLLGIMRELDKLAQEVAQNRPVRRSDLSETMVADYPGLTLHELFMNALIHRNYEGSTTPVTIDQFADRIEIQNPGSLYGDLTRDQFPRGTSYRNPVLAEAAKTLGFANRFGRGIALAQEELRRNGSDSLEFTIGENHMLMIVKRRQ